MALFKSGDPIIDQYHSYSTEQLIQIVTDKNGSYLPGVVEAARSILLGRGYWIWLVLVLVRLVACLMNHS